MNKITQNRQHSAIHKLRDLPRWIWGLVLAAFVLGMLIRGGNNSTPAGQEAHTHSEAAAKMWTCSMHPQIQLTEPGQCPICFMDLIPLQEDSGGGDPTILKMSEDAVALANILTAPVKNAPARGHVRLSGKITVDETRTATIAAWAGGRIEKLYVDFTGTIVKKGQPLVQLYSPGLYAAQAEYIEALRLRDSYTDSERRKVVDITVSAAREKLTQLGLTGEQLIRLEQDRKASDRITIYSPLSGVVTHKKAVEGLYVKEGNPIYTIADLSQLWVMLDVYESDLRHLKVGQHASFEVEAYPGETFESRVSFVDPLLNDATRTARARLVVDNAQSLLKPGLFVRADVQFSSPGPILQVPASAVLVTGKRAIVYVRKPGTETPVFEMRPITLGLRYDQAYEVYSGLKEGEQVVVNGNFKIDSAMQIAAKYSMMNPEPQSSGMAGSQGHDSHEAAPGMDMHMHDASAPEAETETASTENYALDRLDLDEADIHRLTPLYHHYFEAQKALALDEFETARAALKSLDAQLDGLLAQKPGGVAGTLWSGIMTDLRSHTRHADHWQDIQALRKAFEPISYTVLKTAHAFGQVDDTPYFEVFCPMAADGKGAPWLSKDNAVDNPYFGHQMPHCGEVKLVFPFVNVLPLERIEGVSAEFLKALQPVYQAYFKIHQSLAADDFKNSVKGFNRLHKTVSNIKEKGLSGSAVGHWQQIARALLAETDEKTRPADIETARSAFKDISLAVLTLEKRFGHDGSGPYYQIFCSMAFNDTGASWLQDHEATDNPYWGSEMPHCGSVQMTFEPMQQP